MLQTVLGFDAATIVSVFLVAPSTMGQRLVRAKAKTLMLHAHAHARRDDQGRDVPLDEQDPARWNDALIDEAEALLRRAGRMGAIGRYQLEAAVQSAHVSRRRTGRADGPAIAQLYDALLGLTGSPVVAINRAVAIVETRGVAAGIAALDEIAADARLSAGSARGTEHSCALTADR